MDIDRLCMWPRKREAGAIRWFDCRALSSSLRRLIEVGEWRFAKAKKATNAKMIDWALGDAGP